jgi:hypothetical protein
MTDPSQQIIAEVERSLKSMFAKAITIERTTEDAAATYEAKAALTSDPMLAKGYRELAEQARKGNE